MFALPIDCSLFVLNNYFIINKYYFNNIQTENLRNGLFKRLEQTCK